MRHRLSVVAALAVLCAAPALAQAQTREIAFVANAEGGSVSLVDVAARAEVGRIDVNPAKLGPNTTGTPNYAQDTDVSPDGAKVPAGYAKDHARQSVRPLTHRRRRNSC